MKWRRFTLTRKAKVEKVNAKSNRVVKLGLFAKTVQKLRNKRTKQ